MKKNNIFLNTFMEEERKTLKEMNILKEINPEEYPLIKTTTNDNSEYEGRIKTFNQKPGDDVISVLHDGKYIAFHSLMSSVNYPNGDSYKGSWINGHVHGKGQYLSPKNFKYVGSWRNGLMDGWGEMEDFDDGLKYKGQFKNNLKHGLISASNGDEILRGYFEKGELIKKLEDYKVSDEEKEFTYY